MLAEKALVRDVLETLRDHSLDDEAARFGKIFQSADWPTERLFVWTNRRMEFSPLVELLMVHLREAGQRGDKTEVQWALHKMGL